VTVDDFREASDRLSALGVSLHDQAAALGLAYQTVRLMRLETDAKGYRTPPPESSWRLAFGKLARDRAAALARVAEALEVV
jgi:hypothetical protein